jgi:glycerate 2-kinase
MSTLADHARAIFAEALRAVDVRAAVQRHLAVNTATLTLGASHVAREAVDELLIVAIGKAAVPMYQAAAEALAPHITHRAVIISPKPLPSNPEARHLLGPHPSPTAASIEAANAVLHLLAQATPRTAVLFLISGGASAMFDAPLDPAIPLDDLIAFHRALVASGLPIAQMNALRKHLSAVKGGRLAVAAAPSTVQCTLLISDVPSASPDAIGSGPSLPDTTTLVDCREILSLLHTRAKLPASIAAFFAAPACPETPKPTDSAFSRATSMVILSSDDLAHAAAKAAAIHGFHTILDNSCDEQDYRSAATYLLDRSSALTISHPRHCLISVGEVAVTLPSNPGQGGRNQHFALFSALELARRGQGATILSAGSDGIDGHSPAAGAIADETTPARAAALGLDPNAALAAFNSYPLFHALGEEIVTGPTGNNLRDLRLVLTSPTI